MPTAQIMIKIVSIIGARPQIIKAAAISRAIRDSFSDKINEIIVHTGQHYDKNMSQVFFDELEIPKPHINLKVGSSSHGTQTAKMIEGIEAVILKEEPEFVLLYGDTNSTLAGAIAASKVHIPIAHIEAGLRSFNKSMPEEINRIMCDHASTLLFSPTKTGFNNLINEGFKGDNIPPYSADNPAVYHCGDVMLDNSLFFAEIAEKTSSLTNDLELETGNFILTTIHRDTNTDDPVRLNAIFSSIQKISTTNNLKFILPLHPRTNKILNKTLNSELYKEVFENALIKMIPPVSFLDMILLEKNASMIMTDSGGVQKEAYFFQKPCIILRPQTEWIELVENNTAIIADADEQKITKAFEYFMNSKNLKYPTIFGDGKAAEFICEEIYKSANS